MFTARKRHLRKKRFFLSKQTSFAILNASNLKTSKINEIRLSLVNAKLYSMPRFLEPPKFSLGDPLLIVIYDSLEDLKTDIHNLITQISCIGICVDKTWYDTKQFTKKNTTNLNNKLLALLLKKSNN